MQALVREDGLTQVAAGHLLGRHKSWVCRRLALLERLSETVKEDLRLGLVGPALARQLTRLPAGNQTALLAVTRRRNADRPGSERLDWPSGRGERGAGGVRADQTPRGAGASAGCAAGVA